jgi:multidrug transporter EmrE-like cation transporter
VADNHHDQRHGWKRRPARARHASDSLSNDYPIWTGIGAVDAFLIGVTILGEQATAARMMAATLIIAGLVMMKVSSRS